MISCCIDDWEDCISDRVDVAVVELRLSARVVRSDLRISRSWSKSSVLRFVAAVSIGVGLVLLSLSVAVPLLFARMS